MSSNEEYLDSLLKAVTSGETNFSGNESADGISGETDNNEMLSFDELEDLLSDLDIQEFESDVPSETPETESEQEESVAEEETVLDEEMMSAEEAALDEEVVLPKENVLDDEMVPEEEAALDEEMAMPEELGLDEASVLTEEMPLDEKSDVTEETLSEDVLSDLLEETEQTMDNVLEETEQLVSGNEDDAFKEINDLLASSGESDEDLLAMLEGVGNEDKRETDSETDALDLFGDELSSLFGESTPIETPPQEEEVAPKAKKEKKKRKKKKGAEDVSGENSVENEAVIAEKKPGIFKRFMEFLVEEDEEESDVLSVAGINVSEENETILNELDKEDAEKKSDKKSKKDKKKKGKKGKNEKEAASEENADEVDEDNVDELVDKKNKKNKKKKEKKAKEPDFFEMPTKKLSAKKIQITAIFALTLLAAIILAVTLVPPMLDKEKARNAYYSGNYEVTLEAFYGMDLNESDQILYDRAYVIMRMQRKLDSYNNYINMGKETEALNQLIEAIFRYEEIYVEALECGVEQEVDARYSTVLELLQTKYNLTAEQAKELYLIEDKLVYTLKLEEVIKSDSNN